MRHLDLFSGIGGFALAVDEVWSGAEHIFCEIDEYCRALLKKRFEGSVIYGDIRQLTADTEYDGRIKNGERSRLNLLAGVGKEEERARDKQAQTITDSTFRGIFLLTGGFPCQPFSQAGKRRGTEDNRFLWPEMLRVIASFTPRWVIAENVRGLINISNGVVFEQVCLDLEAIDYEVQAFIIPAVAVNAPHRRDRVWIVAHSKHNGRVRTEVKRENNGSQPESKTWEKLPLNEFKGETCIPRVSRNTSKSDAPDTSNEGLEGLCKPESGDTKRRQESGGHNGQSSWQRNWLEVATELCGVDDGLPSELDGLKLSKARHRIERLKALGNAIVPQVAVEIMKAIKAQYERG